MTTNSRKLSLLTICVLALYVLVKTSGIFTLEFGFHLLAVIPRNRRNEHSRLGHQNLQPFFQLLDS
jgi:hypothetical protein